MNIVFIRRVITFFLVGYVLWILPSPSGLNTIQWHLFVVFVMTVGALVVNLLPMAVVMLISITFCHLTNILTVSDSLSGFSSDSVWLVVMACFIARAIIKSQIANRITYYLTSIMGKSIIGISYSLVATEFILSPSIPSATARGGGVIFPIAKSIAEQFNTIEQANKSRKIGEFLMQTCFQANVICSAMFLTAMAGNPLICQFAFNMGVKLNWTTWALGAIIPGIINLSIMPLFLYYLILPKTTNNRNIVNLAKKSLKDMGPITTKEIKIIFIFCTLVLMWALGATYHIQSTTTAIFGFLLLLLTKIITWEESLLEKSAWDTLIWFSLFTSLSTCLSNYGITEWIGLNIQTFFLSHSFRFAVPMCIAIFFYLHYFFASITVYATVMYNIFFIILISLGLPSLLSSLLLAYFVNLSGGLTHYSISSAPIFYSAAQVSTFRWWRICLLVSILNITIWLLSGAFWWRTLGWI